MSGCPHYFCLECVTSMVKQKISEGNIVGIKCAEASCNKQMNDRDIKNLKLDAELEKIYENLSVANAIA